MAGNGGAKLHIIAVYRFLSPFVAVQGKLILIPPFLPFRDNWGVSAKMEQDNWKEITILIEPRSHPN